MLQMGRPRKIRPEEENAATGHDAEQAMESEAASTSTSTLEPPAKSLPGEPSMPTTDFFDAIGEDGDTAEIVVSTKKYRDATGSNRWNTVTYSGSIESAKIVGDWFDIGQAEREHNKAVAEATAVYASRMTVLKAHGLV